MKYIQFNKPEINLTTSDMKKLQQSINSGWFCNGEYVQELERHFIERFNVKHAIACASCTSGLIVAVKALGIKNGIVMMPAFTWPSTKYAINCNDNIPLWCDIDLKSWDMDPKLCDNGDLASQHDKSYGFTKWWDCQISVDIFGNESYIPFIRNGHKIPTIYDAAHGYGLDNLGHRGDIEVVSLSFTKPITSMQGGMILTNRDDLVMEIDELVRLSAKLTEVNAYIALKSIENYDENIKTKVGIRQLYHDTLYKLGVEYKSQYVSSNSNYSTFSITFNTKKKRDAVAKAFRKNDIEVKIYYEPLFKGLPNTDKIYNRIISLPTYKEMEDEVPRICKIINEAE